MIFYPVGPTTFDLINNPEWIQLQEQEIYIHCDTRAGQVDVVLPEINTLNGFYNLKLYIVDVYGSASTNNIVISTSGSDTIDAVSGITLNINNISTSISIVSSDKWISLEGIAAAGAKIADLGSVLFVSENGSNTTGTKGRIDLPYRSIVAAEAAASAGDVVYVFPGDYVSSAILGKKGITYYFCEGANVSQGLISPVGYLFSDSGFSQGDSYKVFGKGNFTNIQSSILAQFNGSNIYFEANNCVTANSGPAAFYSESTTTNGDPTNNTEIVVNEIVSGGNGVYIYTENAANNMLVTANKIVSTATTIVTFDASATGANAPTLRVNSQYIENNGTASDSIAIHNIGGKLYVNCPNIVKTDRSPVAPVVNMNQGSPNQEGYVEINGNINYLPTSGLTSNDYILYMGAGSSKISANIYGAAYSAYAGGSTDYSHYLEGYIESNTGVSTGLPTISISAGTLSKVLINAIVKNKDTGTTAYGIESREDATLVVMQNCIIDTKVANSVEAGGLDIYSYAGSCANNAINVGGELVSNILVSINVVAPTFNP